MHTLNIPLENEEIEFLKNLKGELSWHDFILKLAEQKLNEKNNLS